MWSYWRWEDIQVGKEIVDIIRPKLRQTKTWANNRRMFEKWHSVRTQNDDEPNVFSWSWVYIICCVAWARAFQCIAFLVDDTQRLIQQDPFLWPHLSLAMDRGPDCVCTDHYLAYRKDVNITTDYDPSHDLKKRGEMGALHLPLDLVEPHGDPLPLHLHHPTPPPSPPPSPNRLNDSYAFQTLFKRTTTWLNSLMNSEMC